MLLFKTIIKLLFVVAVFFMSFSILKIYPDPPISNAAAATAACTITGLIIALFRYFQEEIRAIQLQLRKWLRIVSRKLLYRPRIFLDRVKQLRSKLTLEQIQSCQIVKQIHCQHVVITKEELETQLAKGKLIRAIKYPGRAKTVYAFDYDKFFRLQRNYLKDKLFSEFYERYRHTAFTGLAFLSSGRADYRSILTPTTISKEPVIENALKETIYLNDIIIGKRIAPPFPELKPQDKIIVLQLMEEGQELIDKACNFISMNSSAQIIALVTFFSPLPNKRSIYNQITEDVMIELSLE